MKFVKMLASALLVVQITACACDEKCDPPPEAVSEMNLLGVTLATYNSPFPSSVNQEYITLGTEHSVAGWLDLYFSPRAGLENVDFREVSRADVARYPYEYSYSVLSDDEFVEIPPTEDFSVEDPEAIYSGGISYTQEPEELQGSGNHFLAAARPFEAPARATHVELWFRPSADANRELVRRVELNKLYAWRTYIEPLLDERNNL